MWTRRKTAGVRTSIRSKSPSTGRPPHRSPRHSGRVPRASITLLRKFLRPRGSDGAFSRDVTQPAEMHKRYVATPDGVRHRWSMPRQLPPDGGRPDGAPARESHLDALIRSPSTPGLFPPMSGHPISRSLQGAAFTHCSNREAGQRFAEALHVALGRSEAVSFDTGAASEAGQLHTPKPSGTARDGRCRRARREIGARSVYLRDEERSTACFPASLGAR